MIKYCFVMIPVLISTLIFVFMAFALFSVRILFKKKGEFRGTCAGNSSFLQKDGIACGVCGRKVGEPCGEMKVKN
jgi:predicted permease